MREVFLMDNYIAILSILCVFIFCPGIVFGFIYLSKKRKADVELARNKKEILELEVRKEELHLQCLSEENKKYDRIIDDKSH
jgi:hypothetical protein